MGTKLQISQLSDRHPAVTKALGEVLMEAALVCLDRHHRSPIEANIIFRGNNAMRQLEWTKPDSAMCALTLTRKRSKLRQMAKGQSTAPALAAVVGFKERLIVIARLGEIP